MGIRGGSRYAGTSGGVDERWDPSCASCLCASIVGSPNGETESADF